MKAFLACVLLLGVLGVTGPTPAGRPWTILPVGESESALMQCSRTAPGPSAPFWSPAPAQVEELEKRLPFYLRLKKHSTHADGLSKYLRQYVGFTREGRRLIYLNAFSAEMVETLCRVGADASQDDCRNRWRTQAVDVCDGGDDFWGVEYDPETKTFSGLGFNGVA